jgi:hypothetical protein
MKKEEGKEEKKMEGSFQLMEIERVEKGGNQREKKLEE